MRVAAECLVLESGKYIKTVKSLISLIWIKSLQGGVVRFGWKKGCYVGNLMDCAAAFSGMCGKNGYERLGAAILLETKCVFCH